MIISFALIFPKIFQSNNIGHLQSLTLIDYNISENIRQNTRHNQKHKNKK